MRRWFGFLLPAVFLVSGCAARKIVYELATPLSPEPPLEFAATQKAIDAAVKESGIAPENLGIAVAGAADLKFIYSLNAENPFVPGSVAKLITSLAALEILGPDYRFPTEIYYTGSLAAGRLEGALWIKGYGDPSMNVYTLQRLVARLRDSGLVAFSGPLYLDNTYFMEHEYINKDFLQSAAYNTALGPLSVESNRMELDFQPLPIPNQRSPVTLMPTAAPVPEGVAVDSISEPLGFEPYYQPQCGVSWEEAGKIHRVACFKETLAPGKKNLALRRPAHVFGRLFKKMARLEGLEITDIEIGVLPQEAAKLFVHRSAPLGVIIQKLNNTSNNFMAEQIALSMAAQATGTKATQETAVAVLNDFLVDKVGFKKGSFSLENGSGLSRSARLCPQHLMNLLVYADGKKEWRSAFFSSLPFVGWQGTVAKRRRSPQTLFRIAGKTGHIDYVSCFAGYGLSGNNKRYIFAILANDHKGLQQTASYSGLRREERGEWQRTTAIASQFHKLQESIVTILSNSSL